MGNGTGKAALVGGAVALVCIVAFAAAVFLGVVPTAADKTAAVDKSSMLVAVVLPDSDGVLTVRSLDRYEHVDGPLRISSVDPLADAMVPGTSASTLADAYKFGGGDGLAAAYAQGADVEKPGWLIVGPGAWADLIGETSVSVHLNTNIEVFDGTELYSYPEGTATVSAAQIPQLMNGATYLDAAGRRTVREAIGDALTPVLLRSETLNVDGIDTNLITEQWDVWLRGVSTAPVRADTTP